jgi:hypothetical protein
MMMTKLPDSSGMNTSASPSHLAMAQAALSYETANDPHGGDAVPAGS